MTENWLACWLRGLAHLFFPRRCVTCGRCLEEGEEVLCLRCNMDMPRTNWHLEKDNPVEQQFWGKFPLERATSYFLYHKGSDFRHILHQLKYEGREDREYKLTWTDGDLVSVDRLNREHTADFTYSETPNANNLMFFYDIYGMDLEELKYLYWAGLLGVSCRKRTLCSFLGQR